MNSRADDFSGVVGAVVADVSISIDFIDSSCFSILPFKREMITELMRTSPDFNNGKIKASIMKALPLRNIIRAHKGGNINTMSSIGRGEDKAKSNKDMYVFGSAILSETFIRENIIDEYRICIAPVIAGKGRYLFPQGLPGKKLSLISSQPLMTGGVILKYKSLNV